MEIANAATDSRIVGGFVVTTSANADSASTPPTSSASRGGTQLFVTSVARYRDAKGEVVAINRETVVYQPLS